MFNPKSGQLWKCYSMDSVQRCRRIIYVLDVFASANTRKIVLLNLYDFYKVDLAAITTEWLDILEGSYFEWKLIE